MNVEPNPEWRQRFLTSLRESLSAIQDERYFETERGYQGALLAQLERRLGALNLNGSPIVEQEYQKTLPKHGITLRPDVIIHIPYERIESVSRLDGNFVAIELKRNASIQSADEDFSSLRLISEVLGYPLTIFINIDSSETHFGRCPTSISQQTVCFAVRKEHGKVILLSDGLSKILS